MGDFLPKAMFHGSTVQIMAALSALGLVAPAFLSWMCLWRYTPDPVAQEKIATKEEADAAVQAHLITPPVLVLTS